MNLMIWIINIIVSNKNYTIGSYLYWYDLITSLIISNPLTNSLSFLGLLTDIRMALCLLSIPVENLFEEKTCIPAFIK